MEKQQKGNIFSIVFELTSKLTVKVLFNHKEEKNYLINYMEAICYSLNAFLSSNNKNEISFHVYNENQALLIFPRKESDFDLIKNKNVRKISLTIKRRVFKFLEQVSPLNVESSHLSSALFKAFCCKTYKISVKEISKSDLVSKKCWFFPLVK